MRSLEDDIKSMREDMKNMFEILWKAKQNDGRARFDRTNRGEYEKQPATRTFEDGTYKQFKAREAFLSDNLPVRRSP